ncbi:MAG: hypothetical protein ACOC2W_00235 [bacterium]
MELTKKIEKAAKEIMTYKSFTTKEFKTNIGTQHQLSKLVELGLIKKISRGTYSPNMEILLDLFEEIQISEEIISALMEKSGKSRDETLEIITSTIENNPEVPIPELENTLWENLELANAAPIIREESNKILNELTTEESLVDFQIREIYQRLDRLEENVFVGSYIKKLATNTIDKARQFINQKKEALKFKFS